MLKSAKFHTKNLSGLLSVFCLFAQASAATLSFSTYLGGSGDDLGYSISTDGSGNCYVTGKTLSAIFPLTAGAFDTIFNGYVDVFVTKLNSAGSSLEFSSFLGGNLGDIGYFVSVDGSGNAYIGGFTSSTDFPTTSGAFDTSYSSGDVFVTKLNSDGTVLSYSTFLGGISGETGYSISSDGNGNCYITGETDSNDFPTTAGAFDTSKNSYKDAFVTSLNSGGSLLEFSSFIGGDNDDKGNFIIVDGNGNCYVTGYTGSTDFPTTADAYDTWYNGSVDAFVTKLIFGGSSLEFSTYLGGSGGEYGKSLSIDESGNYYLTGISNYSNFPTTVGTYNVLHNGSIDAFVTKLNSDGSSLSFSTYLGGSYEDYSNSLSLDGSGNCYLTGYTNSTNFPITVDAYDILCNGYNDVFISKLGSSGSTLDFSTFFGGSDEDYGSFLSIDGNGNCYVAGYTESINIPVTVGAYDISFNSIFEKDVFVTKFDFFTGVTEQNNSAKDFQLNQNFPNPFNPSTIISYELAKTNDVKLEIFNTKGELVRTLVSEKQNEGSHTSVWNGKDERGNSVSSGVYFYKLTAGSYTQTNKMILLK